MSSYSEASTDHDPSSPINRNTLEQQFAGVETSVRLGSTAIQSPQDAFTTFVMLPAYNEAEGLPSLLAKIKQVFAVNGQRYHVIVVDDASSDDTSEVAITASSEMPITLVRHLKNQNLPGALRSGMMKAIELGTPGDVIVTMDGDDTHPPGTINLLLQKISEGYDVVTASRYQIGSRVMGVPMDRVLMTWGARMLFRVAMPISGVRDYTCGYRAYRFDVLRDTMDYYGDQFVSEKGFSCMADVLLKMRRFKYVFGEVPLLLRYDQKQGVSKMAVGSTVWMTLKLLLKRRFSGY
jgi:dolichol-phosphate mannosyltransferase